MKPVKDEPKVTCRCCNGICEWHAAHSGEPYHMDCDCRHKDDNLDDDILFRIHDPGCASQQGAPGCWGCCGAGCRSCGNTGFIPLSRAIDGALNTVANTAQRVLDAQSAHEKAKAELAQLEAMRT